MTRELVRYAKTFLKSPMPPPLFVREVDGITYEVLAVEAPFQVERVVAPAHVPVPRHSHSTLDALEIYESGSLTIHVADQLIPVESGPPRKGLGGRKALLLPRHTTHGPGMTGPDGFQFLSIQAHDGIPEEVPGCPHRMWPVDHT